MPPAPRQGRPSGTPDVGPHPTDRHRADQPTQSGREIITHRTFDTRREAAAWLAREKAALDGGVDPRAGRQRVRALLEQWLTIRESTVATKTFVADRSLLRLVPTSMQNLHVSAVSEREVARSFEALIRRGLTESSVVRSRASLATFFGWCVREKLIVANPVTAVRVPRSSAEPAEMRPFTEDDLEEAHQQWQSADRHLADVLLVMAWTGVRWGEARAMTVADLVEVPTPGLLVRRSQPEGVAIKSTKSRHGRRVPVADRVLPLLRAMAERKAADALLLTTASGSQLHRTAVLRAVRWTSTGQGRRVHDLRHTAACLWLNRGVDPGTVQTWLGHESIAITNRYLQFLGTGTDRAGLERLNRPRPTRPETPEASVETLGVPRGYPAGQDVGTTPM